MKRNDNFKLKITIWGIAMTIAIAGEYMIFGSILMVVGVIAIVDGG